MDNKHLGDEGLADLVRGLEEALHQARQDGKSTLTILKLSNNNLTCRSFYELSECVRLAGDDIQEIDLANNDIVVASTEDSRHLADFLDALRHCTALRILNLSGNNLSGSRACEVFARTFATQFAENNEVLERLADDYDEIGSGVTGMETSLETLNFGEKDTRCVPVLRGLPSVQSFLINNTSLTDAGALWLSFCVGKHKWALHRLHKGQQQQPASTAQAGFVYLPNDKLTMVGLKLLKQAETIPFDPYAQSMLSSDHSPQVRKSAQDYGGPRYVSSSSACCTTWMSTLR